MSHGESCAGVGASGVVGAGVSHKKLRRKRKELDALVPEDKIRRKSSASHHDLLRSDSEDAEGDFLGVSVLGKQVLGARAGVWACLPGACTLLLLVTTMVGVAAAFRLLMLTRRDLDELHARLTSVEASSSELPAKFHQSHVRLQELEKNQSALWAAVNQLTSSLDAAAKRLEVLEGGVKGIRDSLNTSPQLSSLPKDVAALQGSVATFGSTLQDVHSSLENIKKDHDTLTSSVKSSASSIDRLKEDISQLHNDTALRRTSDGAAPATVGEGVVDLQEKVETVTTAITAINTTFAQQTSLATTTTRKLESLEESSAVVRANLTQQVSYLDRWRNTVLPALTSQVTNLTSAVASLQQTSNMLEERVLNLTQVMDVVKGVEKRLEGSQVQLASSVSELKQHLDKVEKKVSTIKAAAEAAAAAAAAATPPSIAPPTKHTATTRD